MLQRAYREEDKREAGSSLYAQMPQTIETVFAKELTKAQSDVSAKRSDACLSFLEPVSTTKFVYKCLCGFNEE